MYLHSHFLNASIAIATIALFSVVVAIGEDEARRPISSRPTPLYSAADWPVAFRISNNSSLPAIISKTATDDTWRIYSANGNELPPKLIHDHVSYGAPDGGSVRVLRNSDGDVTVPIGSDVVVSIKNLETSIKTAFFEWILPPGVYTLQARFGSKANVQIHSNYKDLSVVLESGKMLDGEIVSDPIIFEIQ